MKTSSKIRLKAQMQGVFRNFEASKRELIVAAHGRSVLILRDEAVW